MKTRLGLADSTNLAIDEIYDLDNKIWVSNGVSEPTLFITTELDMEEVQTPILAFVSGVQEKAILNGDYSKEEEARLDRAIEVIERAPLHIEYMPDFDVAEIERTIQRYILNFGVKYICFDYIHSSMKLLEEIATSSRGMKLREDNILFMLSTRLKELCNKYGVFIFSSTQVKLADYSSNIIAYEMVNSIA